MFVNNSSSMFVSIIFLYQYQLICTDLFVIEPELVYTLHRAIFWMGKSFRTQISTLERDEDDIYKQSNWNLGIALTNNFTFFIFRYSYLSVVLHVLHFGTLSWDFQPDNLSVMNTTLIWPKSGAAVWSRRGTAAVAAEFKFEFHSGFSCRDRRTFKWEGKHRCCRSLQWLLKSWCGEEREVRDNVWHGECCSMQPTSQGDWLLWGGWWSIYQSLLQRQSPLCTNPTNFFKVQGTPPDERKRRERMASLAAAQEAGILLLTPFAASPRLEFARIKLGQYGVRRLIVRNPG